jgi:hypothetical protein
MGELSDKFVFLAASYPSRAYAGKADSHEIARAVKAFLGAVFHQDGKIVFGGHPSISPLVLMMAREYGERGRVLIYQSELYRPLLVEATLALAEEGFGEIRFVEAEPGESPEPGKCQGSLTRMRESMIEDAVAAVFIGGDTGLKEEFDLFVKRYPERPAILVGAPGGMARELAKSVGNIAFPETPGSVEQPTDSRNYNALMLRVVDHIRMGLAVRSLSVPQLLRLKSYARERIISLGPKALGRNEKHLLAEAMTATVTRQRAWAKGVDLFSHLLGAMRSISSMWRMSRDSGPYA